MREYTQEELEATVSRHRGYLDSLLESRAIGGYGVGLDKGGRVRIKVIGDQTPADVLAQIEQRIGKDRVAYEDRGEARLQSG